MVHTSVISRAVLLALCLGVAGRGAARADVPPPIPRITAIQVVGNSKTTSETVLNLARIAVGDPFRPETPGEAQALLLTSELFSDVKVTATADPHLLASLGGPIADPGADVAVTIAVEEKWSWVAGPTFVAQQGNVGLGLGFVENNLLGRNKKLLVYAQYATGDTFLFATYYDPALMGSRHYLRADVYLRRLAITEYVAHDDAFATVPTPERVSTMNYLDGALLAGTHLQPDLMLDLRLRGARVTFEPASAPGSGATLPSPEDEGWDFSAELRLVGDTLRRRVGVTTGARVELYAESAVPGLSDYMYADAHVKALLGVRLLGEHNLILKTYLGTGWQLPFQQEYAAGGHSLRGYLTNEFRGDTTLRGTLEYSVPLVRVGSLHLRGLAFYDTGFTTFVGGGDGAGRHYLPDQTVTRGNQWRNGVGGGLRVYVPSVVLPLLGFDVGHGVESGDWFVYLAFGIFEP